MPVIMGILLRTRTPRLGKNEFGIYELLVTYFVAARQDMAGFSGSFDDDCG